MDGFFVVYKETWDTSFHVVAQIRKKIGYKKVGHTGTLDPFAEGVLVIAVGKALKMIEYLHDLPKTYVLTIQLGEVSSTLDPEGEVEVTGKYPTASRDELEKILHRFTGKILQEPPIHSALRIQGKRAYQYARKGLISEMPKRSVEIFSIEILSYDQQTLTIRVECSSGTYMRSLARDIGEALQCGGYAISLVREKVGQFSLDGALRSLQDVQIQSLVPISSVVLPLPTIILSPEEQLDFINGRRILFPDDSIEEGKVVQVRSEEKQLVGIGKKYEGLLSIEKVLYT